MRVREELKSTDRQPLPERGLEDLRAVTAVIVNWETPSYTIRAARALLEDGLDPGQLVIVDNGSKDGSHEEISRELPGCVLVRLEENIGYARAANVGARAGKSVSYLFVNNDAFVHRPGTVKAMVRALERRSVGIVASRVLRSDLTIQPTVVALQTPAVAFVRASGLSRLIPNRWQPSWSTHWDQSSSREIQAASAVALLVRGETWEQLDGFDEGMYFYAEDLDLCFRARRGGWKIWFSADAEFLHIGAGSTATRWSNVNRREMTGRSEGMMIRRNMNTLAAKTSLTFFSLGLLARYVLFRLAGRREAADAIRATLRGLLARPSA
jgi:N-acetylglucosaminyl-diphospho-decaprenol L-rhamnosyltransferase